MILRMRADFLRPVAFSVASETRRTRCARPLRALAAWLLGGGQGWYASLMSNEVDRVLAPGHPLGRQAAIKSRELAPICDRKGKEIGVGHLR